MEWVIIHYGIHFSEHPHSSYLLKPSLTETNNVACFFNQLVQSGFIIVLVNVRFSIMKNIQCIYCRSNRIPASLILFNFVFVLAIR